MRKQSGSIGLWLHIANNFLLLAGSGVVCSQILFSQNTRIDLPGLMGFAIFFTLGLSGSKGSALLLFFLPLLPDFGRQLAVFIPHLPLSSEPFALPLKSVAGLYLATTIHALFGTKRSTKFQTPWQLTLALSVVSVSCALAISRNLWQSGTTFSAYGALFNLVNFSSNGWHDDYWPLTAWLVFMMAGALISVLLYHLQDRPDPQAFIFRPLLMGLLVSACWGLFQALTGLGLDAGRTGGGRIGIEPGVYGFSADIHAYASLMILGAFGFWGYLSTRKSPNQRYAVYLLVVTSSFALWLSNSRASILIAAFVVGVFLVHWLINNRSNLRLMLCLCAVISVLCFASYYFWSSLWFAKLVTIISALDSIDRETLNLLLAHRPEFFQAAWNMFLTFPLLGIGLINFYRLSTDVTLTGSTYLAQIGGENAHNYFLQSLAELGLVGTSAITLALFAPLFIAKDRRALWPAYCAFGSLCLGNLFSHSFLITETLFIAASLIALAYAMAVQSPADKISLLDRLEKIQPRYLWGALLVTILCISSIEIYRSFYRHPFEFGARCYQDKPLTPDGWSTGLFAIEMPSGTQGVKISLMSTQPDAGLRPLGGTLEVINSSGQRVAHSEIVWTTADSNAIQVKIDSEYLSQTVATDFPLKVQLKVARCFVPRNLGLNLDKRLLGVRINHVKFLY